MGVNPAVSTFADIMTHAAENKSNPKINYQPKDYEIKSNTIILTDTILVVNGSLTINGNFNGIAFVKDNVTIIGNHREINGAIYVGGSWTGGKQTKYGTITPTFLFANSITTGEGGNSKGTNIYTFSNFLTFNGNGSFTGGFFTDIQNDINVEKNTEIIFRALTDPSKLADYVPLNLFIEIPGTGGSVGEGQILSTYPRKE